MTKLLPILMAVMLAGCTLPESWTRPTHGEDGLPIGLTKEGICYGLYNTTGDDFDSAYYVANEYLTANELILCARGQLSNDNYDGMTPLQKAAKLAKAIQDGNIKAIKAVLEAGFNVNGSVGGTTPLHHAIYADNLEVLRVLMEAGANVNAKSDLGVTPLHYAVIHDGDPEVLRVLMEAGANVNAKDKFGNTPLYYADDPEVLRVLQKATR